MDLTYDSDGSEEETQVKPTRNTQAPSLEDEEAFPDFGNASMPAAPSAQNWSAAWSSSKAPQSMPQPVSKPRRKAPVEAPRVMADAHSTAVTTETRTGGGVSWNESAWSTNASKENKPSWAARKNTHYEQALTSAGPCVDPYVPKSTEYSTAPKAKARQAAPVVAAPAASASKDTTEAPSTKAVRPAKKTSGKDSDGFTEVVSHKKPEEKKEKEKSTAKILGEKSAFAALDDNRDGEKESGGKKKGKEKKKEKKVEDVIPEVQVNTAPKKKKKAAAKGKEDEDFGTVLAEDKKKGSSKKKKGGEAEQPASGLPLGVVGAALAGVAGLMFYFSQQAPVVSK